jgi:hypothetical protein
VGFCGSSFLRAESRGIGQGMGGQEITLGVQATKEQGDS